MLELLANHCIGKTNTIYERYKFNNCMQEQAESIDTYITTLRVLALSTIESFVVSVKMAYMKTIPRVRINTVEMC